MQVEGCNHVMNLTSIVLNCIGSLQNTRLQCIYFFSVYSKLSPKPTKICRSKFLHKADQSKKSTFVKHMHYDLFVGNFLCKTGLGVEYSYHLQKQFSEASDNRSWYRSFS